MQSAISHGQPMLPQATRLRVGPFLVIAGIVFCAVAGGLWYLYANPVKRAATAEEQTGVTYNEPKSSYGVDKEPTKTPPATDPNADILAELRALKHDVQALKNRPPAAAPKPAEKEKPKPRHHRNMGYMSFELPQETTQDPPTYVLAPGDTILPCTVLTAMHSDVESNATVKLTTNVYDTQTRRQLLIPQGSTILTRYYSDQLVFGSERLPINSTLLTLPNGRTVDLNNEPVMDNIGQAGLVTDINRHYLRALGAVIIQGVLRGSVNTVSTTHPVAAGVANSGAAYGQNVTQKFINLRPTITVTAGESCNIILTKAIELPAYAEGR